MQAVLCAREQRGCTIRGAGCECGGDGEKAVSSTPHFQPKEEAQTLLIRFTFSNLTNTSGDSLGAVSTRP